MFDTKNIKSALKTVALWLGSIKHRNMGSKILYYHDVFKTINYPALDADVLMGTPLELFKKHIDTIRREGFKIVRKISKPEGEVALMFDDGFRGIWECRDFFFINGICPTIFIPVKYIGRQDLGILTLKEIKELQAHGFIFQSHTWSHRPLTDISSVELKKELEYSKQILGEMLEEDVSALCMPLGYFNNEVIGKIKDAGYKDIYSCLPGNVNDAPFGLLARNLAQFASEDEVRFILRGGNEIFKKRYFNLHCHN